MNDVISLVATAAIPIAFIALWFIEELRPARAYVHVPRWRATGVVFFVVTAVVGTLTPMLWSALGLTRLRVFDLHELRASGWLLGVVVTSGVLYAWHRAVHTSPLLWRTVHQLHHSPQRVDVPGAFYSHPFEVIAKTTLGLVVGVVLLGLASDIAALVSMTLTLISIGQHANVHTPRWLGFVLPRPEMHARHHARSAEGKNFGDLPLWDLLFRTFENPRAFHEPVGFAAPHDARVKEMLLLHDVLGSSR